MSAFKSIFLNLLPLICLCSANVIKSDQKKLVIDHDGGADDAMAIFIALLYEKHFNGPEVVAITTTNGNVNENQVYENTQRILGVANRKDVPIYRGAVSSIVQTMETDGFFGNDGLGDLENITYEVIQAESEHAALALIELSKQFEGSLTVVTVGSLTNIALAVKLDPDFIQRLDQMVIGAGHIYSERYPSPEFNAHLDIEAYQIVVNNSYPEIVTVFPFSQNKESLNISKEWRADVLGAIDSDIMRAQNQYETISFLQQTTWDYLDPSVIAVALNSDLVEEYKYSQNDIILCGERRGINTNYFEENEDLANVRLMYWAKLEEYKQFLLDVFSADANEIL